MNIEQHSNFVGLVVIVTGAGSGIGRAITKALAEAGANVLAVGRRMDALKKTAGQCAAVVPWVADVRDEGAASAIIDGALQRWGRLDALVNNAGIFAPMPLSETSREKVSELLDTNVVAPSLLASMALPHLIETQGAIVNLSSTFGHVPAPGAAHYGATKAAIEHLTRSWALEVAPLQVRVNAVAPGPTESDALMAAGLSTGAISAIKGKEAARVPLGRRGETNEVAEWVLRFIDPKASWVTGQVLAIDGGLSLT